MVVGSFTSVSLDPPLVAYFAMVTSRSYAQIRTAGGFCVNVLAADQELLCRAFAARGADKFAGVDWHAAATGSPILDDAVAWIDCRTEVIHSAGDHDIVVGRVVDLDVAAPRPSLLFFQGGYGSFSAHSLVARNARFATQLQLLDRARPLMEAVAKRTGAQVVAIHCDGTELTLLASAGTATDPWIKPGRHRTTLPGRTSGSASADGFRRRGHRDGISGPAGDLIFATAAAKRWPRYDNTASRLACSVSRTTPSPCSNATPPHRPRPTDAQMLCHIWSSTQMIDNPARVTPDTRVGEEPDVVNLWAPSFDTDGKPGSDLRKPALRRGPRSNHMLSALLELTRNVTGLATH